LQPPDTFTCPVTKLPIRQRPEWQKIKIEKDFELSIELIGDQIILSHSSGVPSRKKAYPALALMAEIIEQYFPDRPYVQIFDYSKVAANNSMEARRVVIEKLKERQRMLGAVYYGLNPMMRASVHIARFFHQLPFPLLTARNYPEAIKLALGLLDDSRRDSLAREVGEEIDHQTSTLIERLSSSESLDEDPAAPNATPVEDALIILEDESRHAEWDTGRHRNQEILDRLDEIIRRRNERARSYQQRKTRPPTA